MRSRQVAVLQRDKLEKIVGSPLTPEREFVFAGIAAEVRQLVGNGGDELLIGYVQEMVARNMSMQDELARVKEQNSVYRTGLNDLAARVQRYDLNGVIPLRQVIHDWWSQWMNRISSYDN
jgi:asparagine synthetase B (glutamine-hydrolysing)